MSELREWLHDSKLEQYADVFEANDIDLDILAELTERDFEQLGISLGNRRRLLKAISERGHAPAEAVAASKPEPPSETSGEAERRQVTVLFCDLVGSTELSRAIDPELLGALIRRYQDAAAGAIARFDGFVAKFMGDGVLAYFGFPRAYEDAAERAAHSALAMIAETGQITRPDGMRLQARIGIATGLVVVGEIVGTGIAQERSIVGETPNLAARLQALAAADTILISDSTRLLLGGAFEIEHAGEHNLKGFAQPVAAWHVLREASVTSRYAASRTGSDAPLIGRAHEIGLMLDRWRRACQGEGQIVTVTGDAGIGKSRIAEAFQERLGAEPHRRIHLQCSPYHSDSALHPVIQHLGRAAGLAADEAPAAKLAKLGILFADSGVEASRAIPLLAELLSIPLAGAATGTPAQRKAATIALLVDQILRMSDAAPTLLLLEDAHWIDATTLDLMTRLVDGIGQARILVIVTARPEFSPPWLGRPHASLLSLGRLDRADCIALAASVAAIRGLSAETIEEIVAKTDGVPLFVEEMTKTVIESAGRDRGAIPATLSDSLMARLDRLGEAREIAQIAAVIGRQFSYALLAAVLPKNAAGLGDHLVRLSEAGIVFPQGRAAERSYSFKHALVRDAAYESLLLARRRELHGRIARALEMDFPEIVAQEPEVLAQHFARAGLAAQACDYRERAGDRALRRSAIPEAIAHFTAGLAEADLLADATEKMRRQLALLLKLGPALSILKGMQSPEAEEVYRRAGAIGDALQDGAATFQAKWGLWLGANLGRKTSLARQRAEELVNLGRLSDNEDLLLEAYHCLWSTSLFRGDIADALRDTRIGAKLYDPARHRHLGHMFGGHDPGVCAHGVHGVAARMGDDRTRAAESIARAITLGETLDHPNSLGHALTQACLFHQLSDERDSVLAVTQRLIALAEKFGLPPLRATGLLLAAWANAAGAGVAEAARLVEAEIDNATAVGPMPQLYLGLGAEVFLAAGRPAEAASLLSRALAAIDEPGIGLYLPEIYRLRGLCLLALDRDSRDQAQEMFLRAKQIAEHQGAILFIRRAEAAIADLSA